LGFRPLGLAEMRVVRADEAQWLQKSSQPQPVRCPERRVVVEIAHHDRRFLLDPACMLTQAVDRLHVRGRTKPGGPGPHGDYLEPKSVLFRSICGSRTLDHCRPRLRASHRCTRRRQSNAAGTPGCNVDPETLADNRRQTRRPEAAPPPAPSRCPDEAVRYVSPSAGTLQSDSSTSRVSWLAIVVLRRSRPIAHSSARSDNREGLGKITAHTRGRQESVPRITTRDQKRLTT
jgi:hypothetical protein